MQNYKYDPFGRRIQKITHNKTRAYAYDGDNVIEELKETGSAAIRYTQGLGIDEPLATTASGVTSYYHADGLGSITSLTNTSGTVVNSYEYDSFGKLTTANETVSNTFRCTAREDDGETKLYYYRARYYDFSTGRFLSEDPIGTSGALDLYLYVTNNPTNRVDAFGLKESKPRLFRMEITWRELNEGSFGVTPRPAPYGSPLPGISAHFLQVGFRHAAGWRLR